MCSFTAAAGWVADVPAQLLAGVYARCGAGPPLRAPSKATLWRVVTDVDAALVDEAVGAWLAEQAGLALLASEKASADDGGQLPEPDPPGEPGQSPAEQVAPVAIAVDGKTLHGSADAHGNQVHLLAAATHDQRLVLAQADVSVKTNEIPMLPVLLDKLDLTNVVITADALHTQRETAEWIRSRGGQFILPAKGNQPNLFAVLDALPWSQVPPHTTIDKHMAAASGAPSESYRPRPTCRSRTSSRCSSSNATSPTPTAPSRRCRYPASPA
jgi:hypothetical protein